MDFAEVISDGTPSGIVKEYCDNGNIQVKGKVVNI
jgi:antitoxin component YwqK of YwqJK toxin-antitoxin module